MKKITFLLTAILMSGFVLQTKAQINRVPADYKTIAQAVENSVDGDTIILSPGLYNERDIEINKALTISSEWILTGNSAVIESTVINPDDATLFIVNSKGVEISGLKIIDGDHTLDINAPATIKYNHLVNNLDAVSMESDGGGYVGFNLIENDRDDGIDLDIKKGTDIIVEYNTIVNSKDDGIEIRLFKNPEQNINYEIRHNIITGSKRAGIQLISYDVFTGKVFNIHHNIFRNCKTGLGCMEGANTTEDLSGASKMDERVYFYNNTSIENEMGATGGNNIIAINNVILGNTIGGFKQFGENSIVVNNLFFNNNDNNIIEFDDSVEELNNIFSKDPLLNKITLNPEISSPCIDAGLDNFIMNKISLIKISPEEYAGSAPNIGAIEINGKNYPGAITSQLFVDAGQDMIIKYPVSKTNLIGLVRTLSSDNINTKWKLEEGPASVNIVTPEKLRTEVKFHQQGIYRFSITCSNNSFSNTDHVTVRYVKINKGKSLFINRNDIAYKFEAEDFAYAYGETSIISDPSLSNGSCLFLKADKKGTTAMVEYSIGMAQDSDFSIWLLVKTPDSKHNTLSLVFNNRKFENLTLSKKKEWQWVKVPENMTATPGQWQFLISNIQGSVYIDRMIFSQDPEFIPE